jgi:D-glycero-alpha-D-manno-heptose-7-phosphate kinase
VEALHRVKAMVADVRQSFVSGDLTAFGELLHENWMQKKRFAPGVTNPLIDESYETARALGAVGGKIAGAGGGGFLMLYCQRTHQPAVTAALESLGLLRMDFRFDSTGARVLMNAGLRLPVTSPATPNGRPVAPHGADLWLGRSVGSSGMPAMPGLQAR